MHGSNASRAIGATEDCRFDDDGHTLYIEVKVTQGSDLHAPMAISNAELSLVMANRHRYAMGWIAPTVRAG